MHVRCGVDQEQLTVWQQLQLLAVLQIEVLQVDQLPEAFGE